MTYIEIAHLKDLALGATILGSGGGGSPEYDLLVAQHHLEKYGPAQLVPVSELTEHDLVVPIAFAGATLVGSELLPSGRECHVLLKRIEEVTGKKPTHLMPAEIGGANALCPFLFASALGLPVVDADTIGRAFPELQMSSCVVHDISPSPGCIVDCLDRSVILDAQTPQELESQARSAVVTMGSLALVGIYLMSGSQAQRSVIPGSISRAIAIGKEVRQAKELGKSPIDALRRNHRAHIFGSGIIEEISQSIDDGFLSGTVSIEQCEGNVITIFIQNEYLKATIGGKSIAITPDIITLLDSESFFPITSEKLTYGLRVVALSLPAPEIWTTSKGLQLVGPEYFGYDNS